MSDNLDLSLMYTELRKKEHDAMLMYAEMRRNGLIPKPDEPVTLDKLVESYRCENHTSYESWMGPVRIPVHTDMSFSLEVVPEPEKRMSFLEKVIEFIKNKYWTLVRK